ncbi:hypothetical protein ACGYD3_03800 [Actinotignum timonense]|uniref:hypothetical protein n=1 Tax=Actinotignum timonense TaxID=1870995 RepID=UPI0037D3912E
MGGIIGGNTQVPVNFRTGYVIGAQQSAPERGGDRRGITPDKGHHPDGAIWLHFIEVGDHLAGEFAQVHEFVIAVANGHEGGVELVHYELGAGGVANDRVHPVPEEVVAGIGVLVHPIPVAQ